MGRRDWYLKNLVAEAEMAEDWTKVDVDEFDPAYWPLADVDVMPNALAWSVVDALDRLGLAAYSGQDVTPARLRLWRKGARTLEWLHGRPPRFVHCPRWVNAMMLIDRSDPLKFLTEENVRAGEAVARMTPDGIDYMVALRAMLTGEPPPAEGGWRRT